MPSCPCQQTPQERAQAWEELSAGVRELGLDLGVEEGGARWPTGRRARGDGRGDESEPLDADGRPDPAHALTVALDAVRAFLARRACAHEPPRSEGHLFCSRCGVRLADATQWIP